ncbi:hypothetical protein [Domibacillus tundrae]
MAGHIPLQYSGKKAGKRSAQEPLIVRFKIKTGKKAATVILK